MIGKLEITIVTRGSRDARVRSRLLRTRRIEMR